MDRSEKSSPALAPFHKELKCVLPDRSQSLVTKQTGEFANCEQQLLLTCNKRQFNGRLLLM